MSFFDDATGPNREERNEAVLVILAIVAIAAFVFWSIVELARLVLRERFWREEIKVDPDHDTAGAG
jgi:hypothetical protein